MKDQVQKLQKFHFTKALKAPPQSRGKKTLDKQKKIKVCKSIAKSFT
jgi:hypothetical protein